MLDDLAKIDTHLVRVQPDIDTTTTGGRLLFHIMSALAEFERSLTVERTKAGLAAAKKRGKRLGRPPALCAEALAALRRPEISQVRWYSFAN